MNVTVVIPCYNEERTIQEILTRVLRSQIDLKEVIVVDDGSSDQTRSILAEIAEKEPRIKVILHAENTGKGGALKTGFAAATGDIVIIQDADLEYDPAEFPELVEPIQDGRADVVYGSRFIGGKPHRVLFFWHSIGNQMLTFLSNACTDLNLTDMETCYKVFKREIIQKIDLQEKSFGIEPEITAKLSRMNIRMYEVGISYSGRTFAEGKKINYRDGFRAVYAIFKYNLFRSREKRS